MVALARVRLNEACQLGLELERETMQTRKGPKSKTSLAAAAKDASANFSPAEFLHCIRDAALSVCALKVDQSLSVRFTTWLRRRTNCKCKCKDDPLLKHPPSPSTNNKKKKRASDEAPAPAPAPASSSKRERKKSKYLSPPYTHTPTPTPTPSPSHSDPSPYIHAFSVPLLFNDFLLTAINPLYLNSTKSANLLRLFFHQFRHAMFLQGSHYGAFANHKCPCKFNAQSSLSPQMPTSHLTTTIVHDVSTVDEALQLQLQLQLPTQTGKDKTDNGAHQPKKLCRPTIEEDKTPTSSGSNMPRVDRSHQPNETENLTGSVSTVTCQTNINVGFETVLNFATQSYDFPKEARAQMMETTSMGKGTKLAQTAKQSQEQGGSSNKCNTGKGDATSDTAPKHRGRKKKIAQPHYPNPAALLLDFSKPNTTNSPIGTATDLPSRYQLVSTFSKFGSLVEAQSLVYPDTHTACVVFARSADAEAAYNSPDKLGPFGPPYASCRLCYLPPISDLTIPAQRVQAHQIPAQQLSAKPQLADIRKNLEIMISSLTGGSGLPVKQEPGSALDAIRPEVRGLLGEMQVLLMKVDKRLGNGSASSCAPQP